MKSAGSVTRRESGVRAQSIAWTQLYPSARYLHAMAYDTARAVTILFGDSTNSSVYNGETWGLGVPCVADFNADGSVNSQDFVDFLAAFFAGAPSADFNHDGTVNSQDFFDFLAAFFAGCP